MFSNTRKQTKGGRWSVSGRRLRGAFLPNLLFGQLGKLRLRVALGPLSLGLGGGKWGRCWGDPHWALVQLSCR